MRARGLREPLASPVGGDRSCRRGRDPRQRAPRPPPDRDRRVRRLADRAGVADRDRDGARRRRRRARRRAVGRAKQGAGRLLRDHDGLTGALEGEQPEHARGARPGALDRRRAGAPRRAALAGARGRPHARRDADRGGRVRADAPLPRRGLRLLARGARGEGAARAAGDADAVEPGAARVGRERERRSAPRPQDRRAGVRHRALRPRDRGLLRRAPALRRAARDDARVQHARRDGLRRYRAVPRPWDFLLALLAAFALAALWERVRRRRRPTPARARARRAPPRARRSARA